MTAINRLYASSGPEVIIGTLQVDIGGTTHYLCEGYEDITAVTEVGVTVTFKACAIVLSLPARNEDGTQDLKFMLCNIDGVVSNAIRRAIDSISSASITFRKYISTDLSAPAEPPYIMPVKGGSWTPLTVNVTAGFKNMLDYAWPRDRYTLTYFQGLRYSR
ncbi:DUF1833 family protein [Klebsiella pneumoniae]|uniref:DUF1833 family protein n=1 Tax=Klebsiella pneumoniae complex TaxID=3390273 RepID=UPI0009BA3C32|nr:MULTISPECIES: DUF1833 family protein [Klebsiella]ELS1887219.1 DUF1833 family protein [Raoultella ornithinolytica]ELA2218217.1 DUF1833 family protein [Klebsiella pneumoniae]ELA2539418.1 DUF1833 family protein [Klebsiella pneumoniae]MCI7927738.1 DUF1833 family protein [Klebsiella pneumoniae]MCI7932932.1 DUF1833 family protein [Klebsiella pneumoniae]